ASGELSSTRLRGRVNSRPFSTRPSPIAKATVPRPKTNTAASTSALRRTADMTNPSMAAPNPLAAVTTPARTRRRRFASGDSRNFSICGRTSSATRFKSRVSSTSRIFWATARPISSRAEIADAVIESGLSRLTRTERKSVPQARQYWLAWRSSDPQLGQNMISGLYGDARARVHKTSPQQVLEYQLQLGLSSPPQKTQLKLVL